MRALTFGLLLVGLALAFCSSAKAVDKSLVLYYSFDEEDSKGVKDLSQYGNDAIIDGKVEYVDGKMGSAMEFAASGHIEAEHDDSLSLTDAHTIAYWLKWDGSGAGWSPFISKTISAQDDSYHTWVGADKVWDYENQPNGQAHGATQIPLDGKWIHLTVTHDGEDKVSFYIDGELDNEAKLPTTKACDCPFRAGNDGKGNLGAGTLDELAVFNRELDEKDIKKLMEKGSKPYTAVESAGKLAATWGAIKGVTEGKLSG